MAYINSENERVLPMLALRGIVIYPKMMVNFEVGRKKSIEAIEEVMKGDRTIFLLTQKDMRERDPSRRDLYDIGTIARVRQLIKLPGGNIRALVEGVCRAECISMGTSSEGDYFISRVKELGNTNPRNSEVYKQALIRNVRDLFGEYARLIPKLPPDVSATVLETNDLGYLADFITSNLNVPMDDKQFILEQLNPVKRLKFVATMLTREKEILGIDAKINDAVKEQIDQNQKDYYLREQLKAISDELYGAEDPQSEYDTYLTKIAALKASDEIKEKLSDEAKRIAKMPSGSHEAAVARSYIDLCLELPWGVYTEQKPNIEKSRALLDKEHYGLKKVKERMLELVAVNAFVPDIKGQIICLVGPPGVGKTSIAKSIAKCLGRKYARVSLGGVSDEAEIRGHRRTYIGSMPGRIINAVKQAGSANPLLLLDEIDKISATAKGDPAAALLETLDSEQNVSFYDHYVDLPFDLSRVLFVTTANTLDSIPAPLLDRMEIIELSSYTREEKFNIAKNHLVKNTLKEYGLNSKKCRITDSAIYKLIDDYTREAGVRKLKRAIDSSVRKAAAEIVSGAPSVTVNADKIRDYFGVEKYTEEQLPKKDEIGLVNGLAWTSVGGTLLPLEVAVVKGNGKIELTGSLGEVMQESAKAAVTYVRSRAEALGINGEFYKEYDIHIHAPEAAIPKDGPSAGVTMTTALVSALCKIPVKRDVAMTGEVSLHGRAMAIGGLKEKTMAAYTAGVKTVFIPYDNKKDIEELDEVVKNTLRIIPVESVDEILSSALVTNPFEGKKEVDLTSKNQSYVTVRQ